MKQMTRFILFAFSAILILACDPDPVTVPDRGEAYFPLEIGKFREYQVDSLIFDDAGSTNKIDTVTAFVRETVIGIEVQDHDTTYLIEHAHRRNMSDAWKVTELRAAKRNLTAVHFWELNQQLVKMEFPLFTGRTWHPTQFVDPGIKVQVGTEEVEVFALWEGEILSLNAQESIGSMTFENVMTCRQADDETELVRRYVIEKYARDIGLVSRTDSIIDSRCIRLGDFLPCLGMDWMEKGEKGYIMRMALIGHN